MTTGVDTYLRALIRTKITVDSTGTVRLGNELLPIHHGVNGERKVQLPGTQFLIPLQDLLDLGAKQLGGRTPNQLGLQGATARWADRQVARAEQGLPPNVYIANARSIQYAIERGRVPPETTYIGRRQRRMTEVFPTVAEVVEAMNAGNWRRPEDLRRGKAQKWMIKEKKE